MIDLITSCTTIYRMARPPGANDNQDSGPVKMSFYSINGSNSLQTQRAKGTSGEYKGELAWTVLANNRLSPSLKHICNVSSRFEPQPPSGSPSSASVAPLHHCAPPTRELSGGYQEYCLEFPGCEAKVRRLLLHGCIITM